MKKMIPSFSFFLFHIFLSLVSASNDDVSALLLIKDGIIDPLDRLKDWKLPANGVENHCNWTGVSCNSNGAVKNLDLSYMNLSGIISDDIQRLQNLTTVNICCNAFTSSLPKVIQGLTFLWSFDVSQNDFVGGFPVGLGSAPGLKIVNASSNNFSNLLPEDLANATLLESLDFRGNFFEGSIPVSYKNLQNLKFLGLSGNNLTGEIPKELGQLKSLETIIIGYNSFRGGIPAEFGKLTNLQYLDLAVGSLSSWIPAELGRLTKLHTIFLYRNKFEGKIPPEIGNCTSLVQLDFSENRLYGEVPVELGQLKNLRLLNLMSNRLTGEVPTGLGDLIKLEVLELWNNSLKGSLPANLGRSSPLQWLDVSSNSLSGEIPSGLCDGGNLIKLILFNNAFSSKIPIGLATCLSLVRVRLQNNIISGTIPTGFGKLESLQRLELANNSLTGKIPGDIALSASLSFIDFSENHLQSSLPFGILSLPTLQTFMASNNNLEGQLPQQFQDSPSLTVIDISENQLSGSIPSSIGSCQKLVTLNLQSNLFTGEIPREIGTMSTLAILNLSNNSLTGRIPENFGSSPALEMLNLSYNKLEGPLPTNGVLMNINVNDVTGNAGLCGGVLSPCSHSYSTTTPKERHSHIKHVIAGWLFGIFALLTIVATVLFIRRLRNKCYMNNSCCGPEFKVESGEWPWRMSAFQRLSFSSSDILASIKESNVIGMGATGVVYKAEMQRPRSTVAVKKLWISQADIETGTTSDLLGEVNLLGRLRHRNIVRLLGYLHNDSNVMIVYDYMRNGSLGELLHGKQSGKLLVDWVSRYNIAVGVAQGLAYLHHDCNPPVIHRDVKSNNILLDDNLDARIADFGIARMMVHKNETVSMVAGSYGYIAPEYGYTLKVDEKSDIYSYGVVLMELLSGKRPVDPEFGDSVNIVEWIRGKIKNNDALEETLDPNVSSQCKLIQEEMLLVLRIALLCTAKLPKDRPTMRDVITMLGEAKPRRKSISNNNNNYPNKEKPIFSTSPVAGLL